MPVAEGELDRVTSHRRKTRNRHPGEVAVRLPAADHISEKVTLSLGLGARGQRPELVHGHIVLHAILPSDGDLVPNQLYVGWLLHDEIFVVSHSTNLS